MPIPVHVSDDIAGHLDAIKAHFKNPRITLVVRAPDLSDGDLVLTDDDVFLAIVAIKKVAPLGGPDGR